MKRLLLAPLLITSLLISDSGMARTKKQEMKKELRRQEQEKQELYISICNDPEKGYRSICNKIKISNKSRITNKAFLDQKEQNDRDVLNICLIDKNLDHCWDLRRGAKKLEWLVLTEEEKALIEKYYQEWSVELDKSLEEIRRKKEEQKNMPTKIQLLRKCEDVIKAFLKDPNSYKRINSRYMQEETGIIEYTATNSFGGRVRESFKCFDP